jgi:thioredoxin reductase (NADPH)
MPLAERLRRYWLPVGGELRRPVLARAPGRLTIHDLTHEGRPMESLVIVGTGAAGLTAAIYSARANLQPLVLSGNVLGGQLTTTTEVENYPGYEDGVFGAELMEKMQKQAERFGTRVKFGQVASCQLRPGGPHTLTLDGGEQLECKALIIATGASPRKIGLPSEKALENKGVSYCAVCDGAFFKGVPIVVVGGGDSALEEANFLTKFGTRVYIIHRRDEFRASKIMAERALKNPKIEPVWNSVVEEVLDVKADKVTGVRVRDVKTNQTRVIEAGGLFVAIGHVPNTQSFAGQVHTDAAGYIELEGASSRTNVPGVFAAGDCADHVYRQAITAAGMGCRAALDAERWLAAQE